MLCLVFILLTLSCTLVSSITLLSTLSILPTLDFGEYNNIVTLVIFAASSFSIGYAIQAITGQYQGTVWNCKIVEPKRTSVFRFWGVFSGLISILYVIFNWKQALGGVILAVLDLIIGLFKILFAGNVSSYFSTALFVFTEVSIIVLSFIVGGVLSSKVGLKIYSTTPDLMRFSELAIFQDVDKYIDTAQYIQINGEEILLGNSKGEFLRFVYAHYNLPNLLRIVNNIETKIVSSFEVGLLGLYIHKRYGDKFRFKVIKTLVKGCEASPGSSFTVITPSGVFKGYMEGAPAVPDKFVFDGYSFVRKK